MSLLKYDDFRIILTDSISFLKVNENRWRVHLKCNKYISNVTGNVRCTKWLRIHHTSRYKGSSCCRAVCLPELVFLQCPVVVHGLLALTSSYCTSSCTILNDLFLLRKLSMYRAGLIYYRWDHWDLRSLG